MRLPRLYIHNELKAGKSVPLPENTFRHCIQVLRLPDGAPLILFNGDGNDYRATLERVSKKQAFAVVTDRIANTTESPLELSLVQGVSKGDHMDFSIQKAVELGVKHIHPIICARSQRIPTDRLHRRQNRWKMIAISACEQTGRSRIPEFSLPVSFTHWFQQSCLAQHRLILDPYAQQTLSEFIKIKGLGQHNGNRVVELLIGPEGGFTVEEITDAVKSGATAVSLGPRTLRTETASVVALSLCQAHWGDLQ